MNIKGRRLFGGRKVYPRQRKSWLRVWEKGPALLVWGPRMVNPALTTHAVYLRQIDWLYWVARMKF